MMDADRMLRMALDEPAPPPPPDEAEDDDDGDETHFHLVMRQPLVIIHQDGSLVTTPTGTLLVGWSLAGTLALGWLFLSWLLALDGGRLVLLGIAATSALGTALGLAVLGNGLRALWRRVRA